MWSAIIFICILLFVLCFFIPHHRRLTSKNWLKDAYGIYNSEITNFHDRISPEEKKYINAIIADYDPRVEFRHGFEISPYSFSISIDKTNGFVNLTRLNFGSVTTNIGENVEQLMEYMGISEDLCSPGFKYYGIGWDLRDSIVKFYMLSHDRQKIECHVFKVKRNELNAITSTNFHTKKNYHVGSSNTVMLKNGKSIDQINTNRNRIWVEDIGNSTANAWIKKMQKMGFILDTFSEYDGKINLYFD